ncbi:MAG: cytochrome c [bacterium]|nr:cytochrome c [bacterium]
MSEQEEKERRLKRLAQWSLVIAIGMAVTLVAIPAAKMRSNNRDRLVERGVELYQTHCASCHGAEGEGQEPSNPTGGRQADGTYLAPALDGNGAAWYRTNRQLFEYIKNGSLDAESPMKPFGEKLSEEEIASILVYIESRWPPQIQQQHEANMPFTPRRDENGRNF